VGESHSSVGVGFSEREPAATVSAMLRYGSVPYLNARPLLEGLEDEVGPLRYEVPGVLAGLLRDGELDVALAPVVASFEDPSLVIVPAAAVVAHGPVKSVLLFLRRPIDEVRTVGLDISSRTSASLVRVLFEHRWGTSPSFEMRASDPDLTNLTQDAALLIGDPALCAVNSGEGWSGPPPVDLGEAWCDWTGLPFVFAAWLARSSRVAEQAEPALVRAALRGREGLDRIAAAGARELGLDQQDVRRYLRDHLVFHYDEREQAGLDRFRELWIETPGLGLPSNAR